MMMELNQGKLQMSKVMVDDNEQIQRIVLDPKNAPGKPADPFYKQFHLPPEIK